MIAPRATYRVQLQPGFGFDDVAGIAAYLAELGVSHVYASPVLQAARGSTHGYDVVAHDRVSAELGGAAGFRRMCDALRLRGIGALVDLVPNHMAIGTEENAWWWDVLRHGASSKFARYFDVDWAEGDRILLPILGERYGDALASGHIRVVGDEVRVGDVRLPIAPGTQPGPDLDALLEQQHWRLGYWRYALGELPYRRFFDVATLAGLRVEDPDVFEDVHRLALGWLAEGCIDGVRIDHIDGLREPARYLAQLRRRAPDAWIVVEKILAPDERVPAEWPVDGTTGYEVMRVLDGVFVDPAAARAFDALWASAGGDTATWEAQARRARLDVIGGILAAERDRLVAIAEGLVAGDPMLRDVTRRELGEAITELLASLPVYRTYVRPGAPVSADDARVLDEAFGRAAPHRPDVDRRVWAALRGAIEAGGEFALRFQQTTGAVMAKGLEDTLFYRDVRFAALCEVGGAPERFGVSVDELHAALAATPPRSLVATATHDTKRGEDVRARLAVLSEIPDAWAGAVSRWGERARGYRTGDLPDGPTELLIWQTVVGAWPIDAPRLRRYLEKATREAKRRTSWLSPDADYEAAIARFADGILGDADLCADVAQFVASIATPTWRNVLARTLVKLTAPGVPDFYQGTELPDFRLVDPDNRAPVDFAVRREQLQRCRAFGPEEALGEGVAKLWLIHRVLALRAQQPRWWDGAYRPLAVTGAHADRVIAFARGDDFAVVVPRLSALLPGWGDTAVALDGDWVCAFTGAPAERSVEKLLARFPVALLRRPHA